MLRYPYLDFLLSVGTWQTAGEAYPDTGFEGGLIVPLGVARTILAAPDRSLLRMADGSFQQVRTWTGRLELQGHRFTVEVVALGSRYLLGREILDHLEVCFQFGKQIMLRFGDES